MPKNKGKGGKNRRRGKNENDKDKRELIFKEDGQEYAQVLKMLGNGRLEAQCFDGVRRLCLIRGKLRKKVWINQSDIILVGLRDYQDAKADVILKYTADEARNLKTYGELPDNAKINQVDNDDDDEDIIAFEDVAPQDGQNVLDPGKQKDMMMPSSEEETDSEEEEEFEDDYKQDFSGYAGKKDKFSIDDI